jgi:hypothetical protein
VMSECNKSVLICCILTPGRCFPKLVTQALRTNASGQCCHVVRVGCGDVACSTATAHADSLYAMLRMLPADVAVLWRMLLP